MYDHRPSHYYNAGPETRSSKAEAPAAAGDGMKTPARGGSVVRSPKVKGGGLVESEVCTRRKRQITIQMILICLL